MELKLVAANRFEPQRVLITRLSAIGDCVLTIPLAVEVKRLWPNCHLTWAVDCGASALLKPHWAVDEILKIEKRWLKRPGSWGELRGDLKSRNFDLVLDPQGLTKSSLLGWFTGADVRVSHTYSHAREVAPLLATRRVARTQRHMVDTYRQLLSPWKDIRPLEGRFEMPVYADAAARAEQILHMPAYRQASKGFLAINPGAGWTTRLWPVGRFAHVAREVYEQHGLTSVVFWAGETEQLMAKVIEETSRGCAVVAPRTNLCELAELLRRASLVVTGDTGPLHLASAVGTPCVSLHGVTWADESGPYGTQHIAIQSPHLPDSDKLVRRGENTAMQAIEVDEVVRGCYDILSAAGKSMHAIA